MKALTRSTRWSTGLLTGLLTLATLAPAASADHGRDRIRYKRGGPACGVRVVRYDYAPQRVYIERHSSVAPALVGFIGGLVLGSAIHSPSACAAPAADYGYWDPYCHERFVSLDAYYGHVRHRHHPRVARVIELRSGSCVGWREYRDGRWCDSDRYGSTASCNDQYDGHDDDRGDGRDDDWGDEQNDQDWDR